MVRHRGELGHRVHGSTVELFVSKTLLHGAESVEWGRRRRVVGTGARRSDLRPHTRSRHGGVGSDGPRPRRAGGNGERKRVRGVPLPGVSEAPRSHVARPYIYEQVPADDEIAVLFTDFRIDDLFGHGPSTGPVNDARFRGSAISRRDPRSRQKTSARKACWSRMAPQFLGAENLWAGNRPGQQRPSVPQLCRGGLVDRARNHAPVGRVHAVPESPSPGGSSLLRYDRSHWSEFLHAPAMYPVWPGFSGETLRRVVGQ